MKIKDIVFTGEKAEYIHRCIFDDVAYSEARKEAVYKIARKASTVDEFIDLYLDSDKMKHHYSYAILAKAYRPDKAWYLLREQLGDRVFKTSSDAGSVKVGSDAFSVLLPNGHGDGVTRVAVVDRDSWCSNFLTFFTSIQGDAINIYSYDCGSSIAKTIEGRYGVYYGDGFVVFEKWN